MKTTAGIILCGGRSRRMGKDKPTLPFGNETLIERTIGVLAQCLSPLIVVAHENQLLPEFSENVRVMHDELPDKGPLGGLLTGLSELKKISPATEKAFVSSCDAPFLKKEFILELVSHSQGYEIAVPYDGKYHHSLSAVYHSRLVDKIRQLIENDRLRPLFLFEESETNQVSCEDLKRVDPELDSLMNTNKPEEYEFALKKAGFLKQDN